jgi:hypothetical protein
MLIVSSFDLGPLSLKVTDLCGYFSTLLRETSDNHERIVAVRELDVQSLGYLEEFIYHLAPRHRRTA